MVPFFSLRARAQARASLAGGRGVDFASGAGSRGVVRSSAGVARRPMKRTFLRELMPTVILFINNFGMLDALLGSAVVFRPQRPPRVSRRVNLLECRGAFAQHSMLVTLKPDYLGRQPPLKWATTQYYGKFRLQSVLTHSFALQHLQSLHKIRHIIRAPTQTSPLHNPPSTAKLPELCQRVPLSVGRFQMPSSFPSLYTEYKLPGTQDMPE